MTVRYGKQTDIKSGTGTHMQADAMAGNQTEGRQTYSQAVEQINRQPVEQIGRQAVEQIGRQAVEQIGRRAVEQVSEQTHKPYENRDMKADRHTGRAEVQSGRPTHRLDSHNFEHIYRQAYRNTGRDVHT